MKFKIIQCHQSLAKLQSVVMLHSCSRYPWPEDFNYQIRPIGRQNLFMVYDRTYRLNEPTQTNFDFKGVTNVNQPVSLIPHKNAMEIIPTH
ncbi:hypothetical protein DMA11_20480 [Marinilabiliaceae bacterium JC017]|nr:hypothetical protein DMA11_20480 [Marinilabiliaceae bacterium JC017]